MSSTFSTQRYNPSWKQNPTYLSTFKTSHEIKISETGQQGRAFSASSSIPSYATSKWPDSTSKTSTTPSSIEPIVEHDSIEDILKDFPTPRIDMEKIQIGNDLVIYIPPHGDPFLFSRTSGALCHIYDDDKKSYKVWDSCIPSDCPRDYRPIAKDLEELVHEIKLRKAPLGRTPMNIQLATMMSALLDNIDSPRHLPIKQTTPTQDKQATDGYRYHDTDIDSDSDDETDYGSKYWFSRYGYGLVSPPPRDESLINAVPESVEYKLTYSTITPKSVPKFRIRDGQNRLVEKTSSSSYLATTYGKLGEAATLPEVVSRPKENQDQYSRTQNRNEAKDAVLWTNCSSKSLPVAVSQISSPMRLRKKKSPINYSYPITRNSQSNPSSPMPVAPKRANVNSHHQNLDHLQLSQKDNNDYHHPKETETKVKAKAQPELGVFSRMMSFVRTATKKNGLAVRKAVLEWRRTVAAELDAEKECGLYRI